MEKNTDNLLPQYAIDSLSDRVYMKLKDCYPKFAPYNNPEVIQACKQIDKNPQLISSVIVDGKRNYPNNRGLGCEYRHYLTSVFIVLYYLHRDESEFQTAVFPQLIENMGSISSQKQFIVSEIDKIIEEYNLLKRRKETSDKSLRVKVDYTKEPRNEVYHDCKSIDDFQIDTEGSIEKVMLEVIYKEKFFYDLPGAEKYILDIFNTAHYITTMILADPRPLLHFRFYVDTAEKIGAAPGADQNTYGRFFSSMALAMVVNYLRICDVQYCEEDNLLIKNMYLWHNDHFDESQWDGHARLLFFNNIQTNDVIEKARQYMSYDDFLPINSIANFERQVQALPNVKGDIDSKASHIYCIKEERDGSKLFSFYQDKTSDNNVKEWDKEMISSFFNEDGIPRQTTKEEWDELFGEGNWDKHFGNKSTSETTPATTIDSNDSLQQQLAEAQKTIEEHKAVINDLKETISLYQKRGLPPAKRKGIALGLTPLQADIFGDYLSNKLGIQFDNKKRDLSLILNCLFGHGISSLANKMGNIFLNGTIADRLYVASIFGQFSPETAKEICSDWNEKTPAPWIEQSEAIIKETNVNDEIKE